MANELDDLINQEGINILVYLSKSISQDPEEDDKKDVTYNPIPIKALVTDLTSASVQWKMPGTGETQGKEILCDSKYRNTIEQAYKIVIGGDTYVGYKDNFGKAQIRTAGNYIRVYLYRK